MSRMRLAGRPCRLVGTPARGTADIRMACDPTTKYRVKLHVRSGWLLIQRLESN